MIRHLWIVRIAGKATILPSLGETAPEDLVTRYGLSRIGDLAFGYDLAAYLRIIDKPPDAFLLSHDCLGQQSRKIKKP